MNPELPQVIHDYVNAGNAHNIQGLLACFSDTATVRDEGETLKGKMSIEGWISKTIEKYAFQFEPLSSKSSNAETVVSMKVSGTFPGSPVTLDFHFKIENGEISSLFVE